MNALEVYRDRWLDYLETELRSRPNTVRAYLSDLTALIEFLTENRIKRLQSVKAKHIDSYRDQLLQTLKPRSVDRQIGTAQRWFKWLEKQEVIKKNPIKEVARPTYDAKSTRGSRRVTREMAELIEGDELAEVRDRTILGVMADTRLSGEKVALLGIDDVDTHGHTVRYLGPAYKLSNATWVDMERYLKLRRRSVSDEAGHLWLSLRAGVMMFRPISARYIQLLAQKTRTKAQDLADKK